MFETVGRINWTGYQPVYTATYTGQHKYKINAETFMSLADSNQ
jgi:hypothetical protein